jgi:hypothetical protein
MATPRRVTVYLNYFGENSVILLTKFSPKNALKNLLISFWMMPEPNHSMERKTHLAVIMSLYVPFKTDSSPLLSERDLMLRVSSKIKTDTIISNALQNNSSKLSLFLELPLMMPT